MMTGLDALQVDRETWAEWKAHQQACRRGCHQVNLEHNHLDGLCPTGRHALLLWRVAIHIAEYGHPLESDDPETVDRYQVRLAEVAR